MHQVKLLENVCKRELIEIVDVYVGNGVCVCVRLTRKHIERIRVLFSTFNLLKWLSFWIAFRYADKLSSFQLNNIAASTIAGLLHLFWLFVNKDWICLWYWCWCREHARAHSHSIICTLTRSHTQQFATFQNIKTDVDKI